MRLARLMAKAWVAVCLYAGAASLSLALPASADGWRTAAAILGGMALYLAMGLAFVAGGLLLSGHAVMLRQDWRRAHPWRFGFGFDDAVFVVFAVLSFLDLAFFSPVHLTSVATIAVERAAYFAVPGQRAFVAMARPCLFDGGRIFASAFTWCLAIVYLGSALSRLKERVAELRLLKAIRPDLVGGRFEGIVLGAASVAGIQFLYVGAGYALLPCSLLTGVEGALLLGLAPLMLAYAVQAALTYLCTAK